VAVWQLFIRILAGILAKPGRWEGENGEFFNGNEFAGFAGGKNCVRFLGRAGIIRKTQHRKGIVPNQII